MDFKYLYNFLKLKIRIVFLRLLNKKIKIVIGALNKESKGWVPTKIIQLNLLKPDNWKRFFRSGSIDAILAEHVWEHLDGDQAKTAAKNCYNYLKNGGNLRVAVPDGFHPNRSYIEKVRPGGLGPGADDHKVLYNYKTIKKVFEGVGFKVKFLEYFNEKGNFNYFNWESSDGKVIRSKRFDKRNQDGKLVYTSLIIDAIK